MSGKSADENAASTSTADQGNQQSRPVSAFGKFVGALQNMVRAPLSAISASEAQSLQRNEIASLSPPPDQESDNPRSVSPATLLEAASEEMRQGSSLLSPASSSQQIYSNVEVLPEFDQPQQKPELSERVLKEGTSPNETIIPTIESSFDIDSYRAFLEESNRQTEAMSQQQRLASGEQPENRRRGRESEQDEDQTENLAERRSGENWFPPSSSSKRVRFQQNLEQVMEYEADSREWDSFSSDENEDETEESSSGNPLDLSDIMSSGRYRANASDSFDEDSQQSSREFDEDFDVPLSQPRPRPPVHSIDEELDANEDLIDHENDSEDDETDAKKLAKEIEREDEAEKEKQVVQVNEGQFRDPPPIAEQVHMSAFIAEELDEIEQQQGLQQPPPEIPVEESRAPATHESAQAASSAFDEDTESDDQVENVEQQAAQPAETSPPKEKEPQSFSDSSFSSFQQQQQQTSSQVATPISGMISSSTLMLSADVQRSSASSSAFQEQEQSSQQIDLSPIQSIRRSSMQSAASLASNSLLGFSFDDQSRPNSPSSFLVSSPVLLAASSSSSSSVSNQPPPPLVPEFESSSLHPSSSSSEMDLASSSPPTIPVSNLSTPAVSPAQEQASNENAESTGSGPQQNESMTFPLPPIPRIPGPNLAAPPLSEQPVSSPSVESEPIVSSEPSSSDSLIVLLESSSDDFNDINESSQSNAQPEAQSEQIKSIAPPAPVLEEISEQSAPELNPSVPAAHEEQNVSEQQEQPPAIIEPAPTSPSSSIELIPVSLSSASISSSPQAVLQNSDIILEGAGQPAHVANISNNRIAIAKPSPASSASSIAPSPMQQSDHPMTIADLLIDHRVGPISDSPTESSNRPFSAPGTLAPVRIEIQSERPMQGQLSSSAMAAASTPSFQQRNRPAPRVFDPDSWQRLAESYLDEDDESLGSSMNSDVMNASLDVHADRSSASSLTASSVSSRSTISFDGSMINLQDLNQEIPTDVVDYLLGDDVDNEEMERRLSIKPLPEAAPAQQPQQQAQVQEQQPARTQPVDEEMTVWDLNTPQAAEAQLILRRLSDLQSAVEHYVERTEGFPVRLQQQQQRQQVIPQQAAHAPLPQIDMEGEYGENLLDASYINPFTESMLSSSSPSSLNAERGSAVPTTPSSASSVSSMSSIDFFADDLSGRVSSSSGLGDSGPMRMSDLEKSRSPIESVSHALPNPLTSPTVQLEVTQLIEDEEEEQRAQLPVIPGTPATVEAARTLLNVHSGKSESSQSQEEYASDVAGVNLFGGKLRVSEAVTEYSDVQDFGGQDQEIGGWDDNVDVEAEAAAAATAEEEQKKQVSSSAKKKPPASARRTTPSRTPSRRPTPPASQTTMSRKQARESKVPLIDLFKTKPNGVLFKRVEPIHSNQIDSMVTLASNNNAKSKRIPKASFIVRSLS